MRQKLEYDADGNLVLAWVAGDIDGDADVDISYLSLINGSPKYTSVYWFRSLGT